MNSILSRVTIYTVILYTEIFTGEIVSSLYTKTFLFHVEKLLCMRMSHRWLKILEIVGAYDYNHTTSI